MSNQINQQLVETAVQSIFRIYVGHDDSWIWGIAGFGLQMKIRYTVCGGKITLSEYSYPCNF